MTIAGVALALLGCAWSHSAVAAERTRADVNQEVIRTYASIYLEQKDYANAEDVIARYLFLSTETGEGDLWQMLGSIRMLEKKLPEACHAFKMASENSSRKDSRLGSLYSYADCLNQVARTEDSKKVLRVMVEEESGITNAGREVLGFLQTGYLRPRDPFPPYAKQMRGQWRVSGAIGGGFDSNVLLLADTVASGTSVSGRGSYFLSPAIQAGYVGRLFDDVFDTRILSVYTHYLNSQVSSFNSEYTRGDFQIGSGPIRWGLFSDAYFLNRSSFELYSWSTGLSWSLKKQTGPRSVTLFEVPIQFQRYFLDSNEDDIRTGGDLKIKVSKRYLGMGSELLSLQLVLDAQYTSGKNYRLAGIGLPLFYMNELPLFRSLGLQNTFVAELWGQDYLQSDSLRKDLLMKVGTGLSHSFGQDWNLTLDYSAQKNLSTLSAARYSKEIILVQLSHVFL